MKFTKRAYVKVWQNCTEDEREDTTITLYDYEDANELNSIPGAPLYLLERHACVNIPPVSYCPRCRALIWPDTTQRFKYIGQNQLAYKHQSNRADILRTLKLKAETQPTLDIAEANQ